MKIEDVMELREKAMKEKEALGKELSELGRQLEAVSKQRDKAEKEGDLNGFREASNEYDSISFRIRAIRNKTANHSYTIPEIVSAWNGYAESYNKNFEKKLESFKQKVADLSQDYKELIELQNEANTKRSACVDLMNVAVAPEGMKPINNLPSEAPYANNIYADTCFFKAYDAFTHDEAVNAQHVIDGGRVSSLDQSTKYWR